MTNWRDFIKQNDRYKDFILLEKPIIFNEAFKDYDIPLVQLHSIDALWCFDHWGIVGYCGVFKWEKNAIIPVDHDSYSANILVYGYSWFNNNSYLDILV